MHTLSLVAAVTIPFIFSIQQCEEESYPPEITEVEFPEVVPGDGSEQEGLFSFIDPDAGVRYALLTTEECPSNVNCQDVMFDLLTVSPWITQLTEASLSFTITCTNTTADDQYYRRSWALIDMDGNESEPYSFAYTCLGTSANPVPVITSLTFPSEINGTGQLYQAELEFSDDNAGVRYLILDNLQCPAGGTCPEYTYDLTEVDPTITTVYDGAIYFTLYCVNTTGSDLYFAYATTLEDIEGNFSNTVEFDYVCHSAAGRMSNELVIERQFLAEILVGGLDSTPGAKIDVSITDIVPGF